MTAQELRGQRAQKVTEARALYRADADDETRAKINGLVDEADALETRAVELDRLEKHEAQITALHGAPVQAAHTMPHTDQANTKDHYGRVRQYSLHKIIASTADRIMGHRPEFDDGLEQEVSQEMAQRMGRRCKGSFYMPHDSPGPIEIRNLDTTTGSGALQVKVVTSIIDALRAQVLVYQLGATVMTDLVGQILLPAQSALANAYWTGAGNNVQTAGLAVQDQRELSVRTVGSFMDIDRRFVANVSIDAEAYTKGQMFSGLSLAIDKAAFVGSGQNNEPIGIFHNPGVQRLYFGNGSGGTGVPTFAKLQSFETALGNENAILPGANLTFVTTHAIKGLLKSTPRQVVVGATTTYAQNMIWEDNQVCDYPAYATTQVPHDFAPAGTESSTSHGVVFGDFRQLVIGLWSGTDILVDPYSNGLAGTLRIIYMQDAGLTILQPKCFSVATDAVLT